MSAVSDSIKKARMKVSTLDLLEQWYEVVGYT